MADGAMRRWAVLTVAATAVVATVALSPGGGGSAAAQTATTTTTPPTTTECQVTSTAPKPTGLTATVNANNFPDGKPTSAAGILLTWDAQAGVKHYDVYRRETGPGNTLELHGIVDGTFLSTPLTSTIDFAEDPVGNLVVGTTYIYRIVADKLDNCGYGFQKSARSDAVTVQYTAPPEGFTGGL